MIRQRCWGGGIWPAVEIAQSPTLKLPSSVEEERKQASGDAIPRQVEQGMKEPRGLASADAGFDLSKGRREVLTLLHPFPFFLSAPFAFWVSIHACLRGTWWQEWGKRKG